MPKKKESTGTVSFQVRLDGDIHAQLKQVAESTEMSLNQLVTGLLRGCCAHLNVGEPYRDDEGMVRTRQTAKCAFVGTRGKDLTQKDLEENEHREDAGFPPKKPTKGEVWFSLDYTGRGFVPGR
ncbi:toxin-antitoxin system HicB family antitoxin [Rubinisphaera margarita]|uniref:toxin-antitoxin system HicB family antitoxin n=1 Tax=Rubinisphaera margarita TaxID=2909586 RepID=UPI0036F4057E